MPLHLSIPPLSHSHRAPPRRLQDAPHLQDFLSRAISGLCALLFSLSSPISGFSPFGPAAVSALPHPLWAAAGAFLGTAFDPLANAAHTAAVLLTYACRLSFSSRPSRQQQQVLPLCAGLGLLILRLPPALAQGPAVLPTVLAEGLLCWCGAVLLHHAHRASSPLRRGAPLLSLCCSLILLWRLLPFPVCAPARCLSVTVLLLCVQFLPLSAAAVTGLLLGVTTDLTAGSAPFFTLVYCVSALCTALIRPLLPRPDRQQLVLLFTAISSASLLWGYLPQISAAAFAECVAGGLLYLLLPKALLLQLETRITPTGPVVSRSTGAQTRSAQLLHAVSGAIAALGLALDDLQLDPTDDPAQLCRRAGAGICRACPARDRCWQREYEATREAFSALAQPLLQNGSLSQTDLPPHFFARCLHPRQLCAAINESYRRLLRRRAADARQQAQQSLMRQQYQGLQGVLRDLAASLGLGQDYYPALESRVRRVARVYLPDAIPAVYTRSGRLHVELLCSKPCDTDEDALRRSLEHALGKPFLPPTHLESRSGHVLRFSQQEAFVLRTATGFSCKPGQTQSGDSFRLLHTDDGRSLLLLSDGMGTGPEAGFPSGRALDMICGFLEAGCSLSESTRAVLPVLSARFPRWGFVTLDLLEVNLFTGEALLIKYGAAPSLLLREGKTRTLSCTRLPAGLEETDTADPPPLRLLPGDRLLLLSDGLWDAPSVQAALQQPCSDPPDALCARLLALAAADKVPDDCTLLVADFLQG